MNKRFNRSVGSVTPSLAKIFAVLWRYEGFWITEKRVSEEAGVAASTASTLLALLVREGVVERKVLIGERVYRASARRSRANSELLKAARDRGLIRVPEMTPIFGPDRDL